VATVFLAQPLRPDAGGQSSVQAAGATLREVIADLDRQFPGFGARIVHGGAIREQIMVAVDADETNSLDAPVKPESEVHLLMAIAGGR
jgi:molybdopterin converting factor small subunit